MAQAFPEVDARPNLEESSGAEKGDIKDLEEVELSEYKWNLIRSGPGQNEADGSKLADDCLDSNAAGLDLGKGSR